MGNCGVVSVIHLEVDLFWLLLIYVGNMDCKWAVNLGQCAMLWFDDLFCFWSAVGLMLVCWWIAMLDYYVVLLLVWVGKLAASTGY